MCLLSDCIGKVTNGTPEEIPKDAQVQAPAQVQSMDRDVGQPKPVKSDQAQTVKK